MNWMQKIAFRDYEAFATKARQLEESGRLEEALQAWIIAYEKNPIPFAEKKIQELRGHPQNNNIQEINWPPKQASLSPQSRQLT